MPQVESYPERERKPRVKRDKPYIAEAIARSTYPRRPFVRASDGYATPTALEIEEGLAHKMMSGSPRSKMIEDEWGALYLRLIDEEGGPATTRCNECHVVRAGRPGGVPCGSCGCLDVLEYQTRRYQP